MRLPRCRLWMLMIVVAFAALSARFAVDVPERAKRFRDLARYHGECRDRCMDIYKIRPADATADARSLAARKRADFHAALANKYDLAAERPWLPVWPDLPEPE
jgi:hypothetical protein